MQRYRSEVAALTARGFRRWRLGTLAVVSALWLAACGSGSPSVAPIQSSAAIWFHPLPPDAAPVSGSTDFLSLFQPNAPSPQAIAKTQVFGLYAGWIIVASDQELQSIVAFLNAYNMGIELEAPALQAQATCGTGV